MSRTLHSVLRGRADGVTWRVCAYCPGCGAKLAWKRRVAHAEAMAVDKAESIRAKCATHGWVDARVAWTIEPNALDLPRVEKPSDLLEALEVEAAKQGAHDLARRKAAYQDRAPMRRGHLTLLRGGRS